MLQVLKDKTIIICEDKISILKEISNSFLDIKFYTKKEFLEEYLFKYDEKALYYLINKYNYKIDVAKMYLDNIYYINENKKYKSNKLNKLVTLKQELIDNNLLIYNSNFINEIKDYYIIVYNYPYLDNFELEIFNKLNATIYNDNGDNKLDSIYVFDTIEEEINYVTKEISKLINKGIDINNIKILNVNESYYNDLLRIGKMYNINIKIPSSNYLISNSIVKMFINNINKGIDNSLELIKDSNKDILNMIINICNKYVLLDDNKIKYELIINDLRNTKIDNYKYKNYVELIDINNYISNNNYVFCMNFNNDSIPRLKSDEDYISDSIKEEVNLKSTIKINDDIKKHTVNKLKSINNLVITAKRKDNNGECFLSSLTNELNLNIIDNYNDINNSYSYNYDLIKLCKYEDNYRKYGTISDEYILLKNNIKDNLYNTFNNKYTLIDNKKIKEYLNNKLILSYSSLTNYSKCSFKYYLSNILKIDRYEDTFEAFIGSLFHDVLEKSFKNNTNVDDEIDNYIKSKGKILNSKEEFYVNKIRNNIKFVINVLNKQKGYTKLDQELYEKNITIDKSQDIDVKFIGFIDKILYKEENNSTYVALIDYKTGNVDTNLSYIPYGLNMQLPIYLYLVKKGNIFINPIFVGFYIQNILDKSIKYDDNKSYEEIYESNLRLDGYSTDNIHNLSLFDKTYEDSRLIQSIKVKNDGNFYTNSKVLSEIEMNNLIKECERVIDNTITNILNANFIINPKKIGYEDNTGCKYCKFKDICFKKEEDHIILPKTDNIDYLKEGDNNA
jgi:ATP-dependent helicase/DNAse subunit B